MNSKLTFFFTIFGMILFCVGICFCEEQGSSSALVQKVNNGSVNWSAGYVEAVGIGVPPEGSLGRPNAHAMAMRAAKVDAYRNLLEITKGVQVDSTTVIRDYAVESDVINTQVSGLVKNAEVVDERYMSDGSLEVKLRMPLYDNLVKIILPVVIKKQKDVPPKKTAGRSDKSSPANESPVVYTGLIIDARGIKALPAISPRVIDEEGNEIYSITLIDHSFAEIQGISGYARDLNTAKHNKRVTDKPLTVKALQANGSAKSNFVVSATDARKIRASEKKKSFLKECRVIIVLD